METTFESGNTDPRNLKQRAKSDLADGVRAIQASASAELNDFVADVEEVVKRAAHVSDADVARIRTKIQLALASAKDGIVNGVAGVKQRAERAASDTDEYVHDRPWQAMGVGAALAAVLGLSIGMLVARRD